MLADCEWGDNRVKGGLNPKALIDSIGELENALEKDDPHFVRKAAEQVISARNQLFAAARTVVGAVMPDGER